METKQKETTYKKKSFLAWYYKFVFNDELPNDFCTLFWNTLVSIPLLPMAIAAACPLWKDESWDGKSLFTKWFNGSVIWLVSLLVSALGIGLLKELGFTFWKELPFVVGYVIGIITILLFIIGFVFGIWIISLICDGIKWLLWNKLTDYTYNRQQKKLEGNDQKESVIETVKQDSKTKLIWNTIRNKYCTKITWE